MLSSASMTMRAIICATSDGCAPVAVSCESITASVPSKTAVATSLASARVGRVAVTIDWSISVATITGPLVDAREAEDLPLDDGHPLGVELDARDRRARPSPRRTRG